MIKKVMILVTLTVMTISLSSCFLTSVFDNDDKIATYDGKVITTKEFTDNYLKNNGKQAIKDSIEKKRNFLDLYVNFKMKILDAQERSLDKSPEVVAELQDYKKKIGVTYLLEKELVDPNIRTLYERRKEELRVSHIMFRPDSAGFDNAYKKALGCLDSLKLGKTFEELAKNNSQDLYSAPQGGDIYYITAGDIITSFEDVCYSLKAGEVYPKPVKTPFGYHLIKVTERHQRIPELRASHILIEVPPNSTSADSIKFSDTINMVYKKVIEKYDFADLAKEFSKDPGTAARGGDLEYFTRRMFVPQFDEAAFKLGIGEVSPIVKTQFGYHIIKVTDKRGFKPIEEEKEELKSIYQRLKFNQDQKDLIDSLKKAFKYTYDSTVSDNVQQNFDSTTVGGNYWLSTFRKKLGDKVVLKYSNKVINLDSLVVYCENLPDYVNRQINKPLFEQMVNKYTEVKLLEEAAETLDKKYPEFASLMNDYENGILIFKLQEEQVWNRVKLDTSKVKLFWESNKEKYQWPDRVEYGEIFLRSDSMANVILKKLKKGNKVLFDTLAAQYTERPTFKEKNGYHGIKIATDNQLSLKANSLTEGEFSESVANSGGYSIVYCIKKIPAGMKSFEDAFPEASGGLQDIESKRLEKEYLDSLKAKYKPVINYQLVEKAFTE